MADTNHHDRAFVPVCIGKRQAERILERKIDAYTWAVFTEFVSRRSDPDQLLRRWWTYWQQTFADVAA